jgi:hypothetical protein
MEGCVDRMIRRDSSSFPITDISSVEKRSRRYRISEARGEIVDNDTE